MRRFVISSDKFSGNIEVVFNEVGNLVLLDIRNASINTGGTKKLLQEIIPPHISVLEQYLRNVQGFVCIESEYEVSLEDFKKAYPYSRNMHLLPPIWEKMGKAEQIQSIKSASEYKTFCEKNAGWYKPRIAAAWLRAKEYLNDWKKL